VIDYIIQRELDHEPNPNPNPGPNPKEIDRIVQRELDSTRALEAELGSHEKPNPNPNPDWPWRLNWDLMRKPVTLSSTISARW